MTDHEACIALNLIPKMGPVRMRKLLEVFETPARILSAKTSELTRIAGIGEETASTIANWQSHIDLQTELDLISAHGVSILTQLDAAYPRLLREIHDPPIVLYVKGTITDRDQHAVSVVGSRSTTHYGMETARKLSYQMAYSGLTVISGLARGIDTAAHQAALAAKGRTIAVIGSGLLEIYPAENVELAARIETSGAIVSEFPMRTKPDRQTFPMRNRIVSGWAFGLLVVEAGLNSGALITASQAADQGRSIYAVPGPIDRPNSQGTNRLIQQGARLVMSASDVLDDMGLLFRDPPTLERSQPHAVLSEAEQKVYTAIDDDETPLDRIIQKSGLPSGNVSSTLLALELKRLVKQLPGKRFVKLL